MIPAQSIVQQRHYPTGDHNAYNPEADIAELVVGAHYPIAESGVPVAFFGK
nr:hypothetical protein [Vibrio tritonius]